MTPEVEALLAMAREDLATAHHALGGGFIRGAINRAYYAAFHAAQAALLTLGEAPKTHAGVRGRFTKHFVVTERISIAVGSILTEAERTRNQADYNALTIFDARAAADLIADVETFVETVAALLDAR